MFSYHINSSIIPILAEYNLNPDYIYSNFNDFGSGFVLCYELLILNNWNYLS